MDELTLQPIDAVSGAVNLPGSKSLSNRILLLAALASGTTRVTNLLFSDDTARMLEALDALGVDLTVDRNAGTCTVKGLGGRLAHSDAAAPPAVFDLGNAGTAMRPLCAALTLGSGRFRLTGVQRMYERPIGDLVDALSQLGADIRYEGHSGYPPLLIEAGEWTGDRVSIRGSISSQFLTALLMAAPLSGQALTIDVDGELVSKPYIALTLDTMARFGVHVENDGFQRFHIAAAQSYASPGDIMVEGDASSASYFLAAAAIRGGTVAVTGIGQRSVQGDIRFADVLAQMGATVRWYDDRIEVTRGRLHGIDADMNDIPDAAMTIATTALFADSPTCIRNIYNWRLKETDRLSAMANELQKLGATVEEGRDYLKVSPLATLRPARIATYDDHRMAMCFSLAALGDAPVTIEDPGCTAKTFPDYFERFASICHVQVPG